MAEELRRLEGPYELLDMADMELKRLRVKHFERGTMVIHPRYAGAPAEKTIEVLRVHVDATQKPTFPHYWDVTSRTLIANWLPFLLAGQLDGYEYVVQKRGVPPRARFTLEQVPL